MADNPIRTYILVGMMGAGKSAIGRSVAELSGRPYHDTDSIVQNRLGRSITQFFQIYGEEAFREHEAAALRSLEPEAMVLATGGGVVLRDDNWQQMNRLGPVLYLRVPDEVLIHRLQISRKKRPLLETEDWQATLRSILKAREPHYLKADAVLDLESEGVEEVAERAYEIFLRLESDSNR